MPKVPAAPKKPKALPLFVFETISPTALKAGGCMKLEDMDISEVNNMSIGTLFTCDNKIPLMPVTIKPKVIIRDRSILSARRPAGIANIA